MKKKKIRVAVLFGGKSAEHEVSIQSAKNVVASLDETKYDVVLVGIDKQGSWHTLPGQSLLTSSFAKQTAIGDTNEVRLVAQDGGGKLVSLSGSGDAEAIDVVFPILHGPFGEDGSMQGFLKLANVPFVGSGVLGSAVGMDKDISKRLLKEAGLPIAQFLVFRKNEKIDSDAVIKRLGLPLFVKPANLGSSIGVKKVHNKDEFSSAISEAFTYDNKILIEEAIVGKEVECSILGNDDPIASLPGEIVANHEFYDYDAKYFDEKGAVLCIPANIPKEKIKEVQALAIKTFKTLCLEGMARIDFFYTKDQTFFVNEANTIPGFTNISMYPQLWEASGMSYAALVDRLIELALEKYASEQHLSTTVIH